MHLLFFNQVNKFIVTLVVQIFHTCSNIFEHVGVFDLPESFSFYFVNFLSNCAEVRAYLRSYALNYELRLQGFKLAYHSEKLEVRFVKGVFDVSRRPRNELRLGKYLLISALFAPELLHCPVDCNLK